MQSFKGINIIGRYLKPYQRKVCIIGLIALAGSFIAAIIPYIYGRLVDLAITKNSDLILIVKILGFWFLLSLLGNWLNRIAAFRGNYIGVDAGNELTIKIAGHILDLPISFHKDKKMGEVNRRISRASSYLENIIGNVVFYLLPNFLTVIVALGIMFWVEWRLASLLLFVLLIYALVSLWKTAPIIKENKKLNKVYEHCFGDLFDSISNIQTVKSCTREEFEKQKLNKNFKDKVNRAMKSFLDLWRSLEAWQEILFSIGFVGVFAAAIFMLRFDLITAGQLVMFVGYISLAYRPFGMLANFYRQIRSGLTAIERAEKLMSYPKEAGDKKRERIRKIKGEVEFRSVSFAYNKEQKVLKDINFIVKPGQMVALVGESGVGKTTLIDLISGYYSLNQGKIYIDGQDISKIILESLRKNMAVVPQEITLFNDTIRNNIRYGNLKATAQQIQEAAKSAYADRFIKKFPKGYQQLVGERGIKLSTGQKQRIAIARAILRDPKILILDEATSSLDTQVERLVQKALNYLIKGRTTFVIAHRLSTIQKADLILVLEKGKIVEQGTHQQLIKQKGVYQNLCQMQDLLV